MNNQSDQVPKNLGLISSDWLNIFWHGVNVISWDLLRMLEMKLKNMKFNSDNGKWSC